MSVNSQSTASIRDLSSSRRTVLKSAAIGAAGVTTPWLADPAAGGPASSVAGPLQTRRSYQSRNGGGFSAARLERLNAVMAGHVERGGAPALVTVVSRDGETHVEAIGTTTIDGSEPMQRDTTFRIASVTKPITAAAAMILVEECVLRLDDPVDPLLPELADRQVLRTLESPLDDTVPAKRSITLRHLLTFRLGYGMVFAPPGTYPIQQAMEASDVFPMSPPEESCQHCHPTP